MTNTLTTSRMSGSLGAELHDTQLAELDDAGFEALCEQLWEHQILLVRNQRLTPDQHVEFGRRFGELHHHPRYNKDGLAEILYIRNIGKAKTVTEVWHSDVSCEQRPPSISILHAVDVPAVGGDTMWADQYAAFESLSDTMKSIVEPLNAIHEAYGMTSTCLLYTSPSPRD